MFNIKKYSILLILVALISSCGKDKQEKSELVIGSEVDFKPMEFYDKGKIVGYDIDVINAIAKKLGKTTKIVDVKFSTILTDLAFGKIDVAISSITITKEREKQVNFTQPYYEDKTVVLVKKDNNEINSIDDLKNKSLKLGTQLGTTQDFYVDKNFKNSENVKYDNASAGMLAMNAGKIDAFIIDKNAAKVQLSGNPTIKLVDNLVLESEKIGIAINKNNVELLKQFNKVLDEMKETGELQALQNKWGIN